MSLVDICQSHSQLRARQTNTELKVYVECKLDIINHKIVRAHLDSQSIGTSCTNLNPQYRAVPSSSLIMDVRTKTIPHACCYRSVLCESHQDPASLVHIATHHILKQNKFSLKQLCGCTVTISTIQDNCNVGDIVEPNFVHKENGTTYIPLRTNDTTSSFVVETFQYWRAPTFASIETLSISEPLQKDPQFGIRVSAISSPPSTLQTTQDICLTVQQLIDFTDLLVYG